MAFAAPGGITGNATVFGLEASGHLLVNYARNVEKSVNKYTRITPVKVKAGPYLTFNPLDLARLTNVADEGRWAPGTPSPDGFALQQGFEQATFRCDRKAFSTTLDTETVDVANWDVVKTYVDMLGQHAMTHRIQRVASTLTTSGNYAASHVATATSLGGGVLSGGTTADPRIKKALDAAALVIQKDTLGRATWGNLSVVINNDTALKWSQTREIREYVMQQPDAYKEITMDGSNLNAKYGLPKKLYGFNIIVEDAYYVSSKRNNATTTVTSAFPDNTAVMLLAEGDLEQAEGSYSFNTCHVFAYEDFTVEQRREEWDRLLKMRVVMNYDVRLVAPATGFLITNLFS